MTVAIPQLLLTWVICSNLYFQVDHILSSDNGIELQVETEFFSQSFRNFEPMSWTELIAMLWLSYISYGKWKLLVQVEYRKVLLNEKMKINVNHWSFHIQLPKMQPDISTISFIWYSMPSSDNCTFSYAKSAIDVSDCVPKFTICWKVSNWLTIKHHVIRIESFFIIKDGTISFKLRSLHRWRSKYYLH